MEDAVSGIAVGGIGALVALSVLLLLAEDGPFGGAGPVACARGAEARLLGSISRLCRRLGAPLMRIAAPNGLLMEALAPIRAMRVKGGAREAAPFMDAEAALGALPLLSMATWGCAFLLSGSWVVGMPFAAAPLVALLVGASARRRARERELEQAMPEAFSALAIALGSGHSLAQAMRYVGAHAHEPVKAEFMRVGFSIDCGIPAATALDELMRRLPAPGLDLVTLSLKVSQRTGAPLKDLLADAARLVGTRIELKRMLDVKTAQARMSARMVGAMPVAMISFLALLSPDFRHGLAAPAGLMSVLVALALDAVAWLIIRSIMRIRLV